MDAKIDKLYTKYPELRAAIAEQFGQAHQIVRTCFLNGGKLLVCGNGGSAADAEHIVGELMKGFMKQRPVPDAFRMKLAEVDEPFAIYVADHLQGALPAISLGSQTALMTAFANDAAPDLVFAQQVYGYGKPEDVLLAISTSGNSANVLHALRVAKAIGMRTIGLTGRTGGSMKSICDATICVPYDSTPDIQERHLPIYHALCILIEEEFFSQ